MRALILSMMLSQMSMPQGRQATFPMVVVAIAAHTCSEVTVTVQDIQPGAQCVVGWPQSPTANLIAYAYASAANTVKVRICNFTTAAITPAVGTASVRCFNP